MNGDLVDRGSWSIEVILTAFALKCMHIDSAFSAGCPSDDFIGLYPNRMYINRGNHEAKEMNRTYGFEGEAKHKHGEQSYKVCDTLPCWIQCLILVVTAVCACIHRSYVPSPRKVLVETDSMFLF